MFPRGLSGTCRPLAGSIGTEPRGRDIAFETRVRRPRTTGDGGKLAAIDCKANSNECGKFFVIHGVRMGGLHEGM